MALRIVTCIRMYASSFSEMPTRRFAEGVCRHWGCVRRCADGGSPSGIATADDRRWLGVRLVIEHASPRRTAAKGSSTRSAGRFVLAGWPQARENDGYKQGVAHGRSCDNLSCVTPQPPGLRAADFHGRELPAFIFHG
jgi:hypothetical protein